MTADVLASKTDCGYLVAREESCSYTTIHSFCVPSKLNTLIPLIHKSFFATIDFPLFKLGSHRHFHEFPSTRNFFRDTEVRKLCR